MSSYGRKVDDCADNLRRRIALYEIYLINGVKAQFSRAYLDEIRKAEAELRAMEGANRGSQ